MDNWQFTGTTVTQITVTNLFLQVQLRVRDLQCTYLWLQTTTLWLQWCQVRVHWNTGWRSVVFSNENWFCLVTVIVIYWLVPGKKCTCNHFQRPSYTETTPRFMVWRIISYDSRDNLVVIVRTQTANLYICLVNQPVQLPFINSVEGGVLVQYNAVPLTAIVTQHALQSAGVLS